jgi:adenylylsulfate kinase
MEAPMNNDSGIVIWLTGLSGSGKTTICDSLAQQLSRKRYRVQILDGDVVRENLCHDLSFSKADRDSNIRRIGFVSGLLAHHGVIVLVAAISPYRNARNEVRKTVRHFVEVYVNTSLSECESRDVKGLYKKARAGQIKGFTGIDDPYEPPLDPEVECNTATESITESVEKIMSYLNQRDRRSASIFESAELDFAI